MSSSVNTVVLVGRLTKDVELMKTKSSGISYCRFTVACDRRKVAEDKEPGTDFITCIAWRQSADFISSYGSKGTLVAVNGSIQTGSYTDRDGRKVYTTDVLADRIQILESKKAKADYPSNGRSVTMDELSRQADDGFDTGGAGTTIDPDDLPF